jgi:phage terminase small subunit
MAKRGPKGRPTRLKLLANAQPCRVNGAEPVAPPGLPEPPAYLDGQALDLWHELALLLHGMGVLTLADRHSLGLLCDSYRRWREAPEIQNRREEFRKLLAEFGLTPSSRSAIKLPQKPPADPLADFLGKHRA